eukprot:6606013-Pyramimonas_sp.AAC.1
MVAVGSFCSAKVGNLGPQNAQLSLKFLNVLVQTLDELGAFALGAPGCRHACLHLVAKHRTAVGDR